MRNRCSYVDFMDDEKLMGAVEKLYRSYQKAFMSKKLKEVNKNIIDPFKFQFDTEFLHGGNPEIAMQSEIFRQNDKTITNAIGLFQQQLVGAIHGFAETPELPCDVRKLDNTIFAEIKNKHNTMNARSAAGVYDELAGLSKSYPKAMCYLVEIIAKKSCDEVWSVTVNQTVMQNKHIHVISADRFYALATGKDSAFFDLCKALPDVIRDFLAKEGADGHIGTGDDNQGAYKELCDQAATYSVGVIEQMYRQAFSTYLKFKV